MYPHQQNEVEYLWESLLELVPEQNFLLVAFQVENWNRDFSPWEASAVFGKEGFAGQGLKTLRWLTEECVPHIDRTFGVKDREHWLMGYSLAGLFALWAAYESDVFSGIVCFLVRRTLHRDRLPRSKQTAQQKQQEIISRSDHDLLRISFHRPCLMQISGNTAPQLQLPLRVAKLKQGAFLFHNPGGRVYRGKDGGIHGTGGLPL